MLVPFKPNGKAQHVKGFLRRFAQTARNTAGFLNQLAALNIPMVGVDPALVLCYRDEYQEALGRHRGDFNVLLSHEWLTNVLPSLPAKAEHTPEPGIYLVIARRKRNCPMQSNNG